MSWRKAARAIDRELEARLLRVGTSVAGSPRPVLDADKMAPLDHGLPLSALVFPRYRAGAAFEHCRIAPAEALAELCHARSTLDRRADVLAETLRWVESIPAYRLTDGNLDRARECILSLLAVK